MPFHPNSFSHNRFGHSNEFTTRFANNWALVVSLPIEFADAESAPLKLIEVSVMSGQRLLEFDRFSDCAALVTVDMYAELMQAVKNMPEYDPNADFRQAEVVAGINAIRQIVSLSYSHSNSKKA